MRIRKSYSLQKEGGLECFERGYSFGSKTERSGFETEAYIYRGWVTLRTCA